MASIRKLPDGRFQAQFRPIPGGNQVTRTARKRIDVQLWLDEQVSSVVTGTYADPAAGRTTFEDFFADWSRRQVWAPGTERAMALAAGSVPFGGLPLRLIRRSHIESWVATMARKPLAPGTIHTRFTNVRSVFRAAVADRVIGADPTDHVMLPRRRRTEAAMSIPTSAEVGRMLAAAGEEFAPYVAVCAFGGLRLGEAAALQVDDIDFMRRTLTVSRQVQRERAGEVEIRPPKYGSERVVFIPEELAQLLNRHVIEHLPDFAPERWLFTGSVEGVPPHQNAIGHRWRMTLERAGLAGRYRLHDLRHYCASGLIAAGCDVVTVQRALGHRSATTTLNTYSHLCPTAEDRTRMAAAGLLAEASAAADEYLTNARATTRG